MSAAIITRAIRILVTSLLFGLLLAGSKAEGSTQDNASISLHAQARAKKSTLICTSSTPNALGIPCRNYVTSYPQGLNADVYLVVTQAASGPGISGVSCGIEYDDLIGVFGWELCADLHFPNGRWPESGGGNRITWAPTSNCQRTVVDGDGVHAVAGAIYVYSYSSGKLWITTNNGISSGPELRVADCNSSQASIPLHRTGMVGFGGPIGCNPCLEPCAAPPCNNLISFLGADTSVYVGETATISIPIRNLGTTPADMSVSCSVDGAPSSTSFFPNVAWHDTIHVEFSIACEEPDLISIVCITESALVSDPDCSSIDTSSVVVTCFEARPEILSVTDVPEDDGGWVRLRVRRAPFDIASQTQLPIEHYEIYRRAEVYNAGSGNLHPLASFPPGTWESVTSLPATQSEEYFFSVPTAADSSAQGPGYTAFVVVARTIDDDTFFTSAPDSGYSVANRHPEAPFSVAQNQPNPFRESTVFTLSTDSAGMVRVRILDLSGRELACLYEAQAEPGEITVSWDGRSSRGDRVAAGVYFYEVLTPTASATRKLVLLP